MILLTNLNVHISGMLMHAPCSTIKGSTIKQCTRGGTKNEMICGAYDFDKKKFDNNLRHLIRFCF